MIGYIEEEDEEDEEEKKNPQQSTWAAASTDFRLQLTLAPFRKAVLQSGNLGQSVSNPIVSGFRRFACPLPFIDERAF